MLYREEEEVAMEVVLRWTKWFQMQIKIKWWLQILQKKASSQAMPRMGQRVQKMWKEKHFENKCRSDRSQSQDNNWKQNHDKSQSQHNKSQDNSKKFHEVDRDDGFDYWYGAEANPESRWDHFDNNYDSVCVVHNVDDIDIGQLQLKSIDPIISRNNTKCFYFDIDDVKYSDVHQNDSVPPGVRWRLMITLNMASKARYKGLRCKIDTRSDGNLLPIQVYLSLFQLIPMYPYMHIMVLKYSSWVDVNSWYFSNIEVHYIIFTLQIYRLHYLVYLTWRTSR